MIEISLNQGIFAFYRGQLPLVVLLTANHCFKFVVYDNLKASLDYGLSENSKTILASSISAVLLTTLMYPIDLCHTRMSADMSKKQSVYKQDYKNKDKSTQAISKQKNKLQQVRLYENINDCLRKS